MRVDEHCINHQPLPLPEYVCKLCVVAQVAKSMSVSVCVCMIGIAVSYNIDRY